MDYSSEYEEADNLIYNLKGDYISFSLEKVIII